MVKKVFNFKYESEDNMKLLTVLNLPVLFLYNEVPMKIGTKTTPTNNIK